MLKKILIGVGILFVLFVVWSLYGLFIAKPVSPNATASYNEGGFEINVTYSQPSKKGRLIFGEEKDEALQPYGKYWRLGANASTDITFNKDVTFGGNPVKTGTYRMYAVPGAASFKVVLNDDAGTFFGAAEPDYDLDVASVEAPVTKPDSEVETFVITFNTTDAGVDIVFTWDQTQFSVPIVAQ